MKTVKEYLVQLLGSESAAFVKVFEALPADKLDWKPDPKSKSAMEMVAALAGEAASLPVIFETGVYTFDPEKKENFASVAEAVTAFKAGMEKAKADVEKMTDTDWAAEAKMVAGGKDVWKSKKGDMGLGFMLDMIHHRGQLATYIRPMGGKVPSIYGPSADTAE